MSILPESLIAEFQAVSRQRLDTMSRHIIALHEGTPDEAIADEVAREAHTIKGEARMLGLETFAAIAHRFEDLLGACRTRGFTDTADLDDTLAGIDVLLAFLATDPTAPPPPEAAALADAWHVRLEARLSQPVGTDAPWAELTAAVSRRLPLLHDQADALLADATHTHTAELLVASLEALRDQARALGLEAAAHHFWSLLAETEEAVSLDAMAFGDMDVVKDGLDLTAEAFADRTSPSDRDRLLAEFADRIQFDPGTPSLSELAEEATPSDTGPTVPREMLDEYQVGALVRVDALSQCLLHLEEQPGDTEVADQLLREAHTLKGDARVVGLMDLGQLVHRFEDLLLATRKGGFQSSAHIDLALAGVDLIHQVLNSDLCAPVPATLEQAIGHYFHRIDALERGEAPPAPAAPVEAVAPTQSTSPAAGSAEKKRREFLHVPAERVEQLIHLSGELSLWQTQQDRIVADIGRLVHDLRAAVGEFRDDRRLDADIVEKFDALAREMGSRVRNMRDEGFQNGLRLTELQDSVGSMQLVAVRTVFGKYPRAVRAMARDLGKKCVVELEGEHVAVDKQVLNQIEDALLHLVRNSVDHGIESPERRLAAGKPEKGTLRLSARNRGAFVEVEISDDGGGIDASKIGGRLVEKGLATADEVATMNEDTLLEQIFRPGFSTAAAVTDISGRGVGMDVVKRQIDAMGGSVTIQTRVGHGTRFILSLPVSASVTQSMVFRQAKGLFAMPSTMIESMLHVLPSAVRTMGSRTLLVHNDDLLGLYDLDQLLGFDAGPTRDAFWRVAILRNGDRRIAIRIGSVLGERKLVQQASDAFLSGLNVMAGTARIEGGELVTVLNVGQLIERTRSGASTLVQATPEPEEVPPTSQASAEPSSEAPAAASGPAATVLIVEDSDLTRRMLVSAVSRLGHQVIEAVNGREGLELASVHRPDIIMTDLDMPVLDGLSMLRELRAAGQTTPVVVMTTRESEESKADALAAGANAYLLKSTHSEARLKEALDLLLPGVVGCAA